MKLRTKSLIILSLISTNALSPMESSRESFFQAAKQGNSEIIHQILAISPDMLNTQNNEGNTALMIAAAQGHSTLVKELLAQGADVNLQNNAGLTALLMLLVHNSAYTLGENHLEIVTLLVNKNTNLHLKDKQGRTALMIAQDIYSEIKGAELSRFFSTMLIYFTIWQQSLLKDNA